MSPITQAVLGSWSVNPLTALGLLVAAFLYWRGWKVLHRTLPSRFPAWRLVAFLGGLSSLWIAIASPLDAFSGLLLSAHMVQHLLLLSVAPPLLLLGAPFLPILRGLPRAFAREGIGPFLVWPTLRRVGRSLTHPVVCWLAAAVVLCAWHVPAAFQLAILSPAWHKFEHACFFGSALLFWWPVVRPFPSRPHWPSWAIALYLLAFDVVNTALCALLTFSERVLYQVYQSVPRLFGTTALGDQIAAGVLMWVPGSLAFLVPAVVLMVNYLSPTSPLAQPKRLRAVAGPREATPRIAPGATPFDLLRVPYIGRLLRAKYGRRTLQSILLIAALAVVADGFFGPPTSAANLAGVLPWIHWRGLTVMALLVAGNFFCMACPFMLPRELGRRIGWATRSWPRALRSKWLAVALLVVFFWAYEAFDLWDRPAWTAWLVVGYFVAAFCVDTFFRKASFCKYVCPIGQFHFVSSLISPLEVKVREPSACANCTTHDCLRGNDNQRGCETDLFLPRKSGNLDCTFCLDCVRACPHDNVGLLAVVPGMDLLRDQKRAGLGRLSRRPDIAALALLLVFAAFAGAAAMTGPVVEWRESFPPFMVLFGVALAVVPALAFVAGKAAIPSRELFCRLSLALVPLGTSMWAAHFLFHLLTSYGTAWPIFQQAVSAIGFPVLGQPNWAISGAGVSADNLLILQTLILDAGLLLTLYIAWRIVRESTLDVRQTVCRLVPWVGLAVALYASGIWIFLQPMQMRGMPGL